MSNTIHVFDFIDATATRSAAFCVVFGDEPFLKRLALRAIRGQVLGDADAPFESFDGTTAEWRDVHDELSTVALFGGGRRLAVSTMRRTLSDAIAINSNNTQNAPSRETSWY